MLILALDSSAGPASCALVNDQGVLASAQVNTRLTHSQTLLPMVENMLHNAGVPLGEIDACAVSVGPGSFTGIRIGVAAVKGIAFSDDKPCIPVSTLEAIAQNAHGMPFTGVICPAMDARCRQVYAAFFFCDQGRLTRIAPDAALSLEDWARNAISFQKPLFCVGDGAQLCYNTLSESGYESILAPVHLRYQTAIGVAAAALREASAGPMMSADALQPLYLRLPQAERELKIRLAKEK